MDKFSEARIMTWEKVLEKYDGYWIGIIATLQDGRILVRNVFETEEEAGDFFSECPNMMIMEVDSEAYRAAQKALGEEMEAMAEDPDTIDLDLLL
ncbi:MAG: hypothetical protein K6A90_14215 [Lachnospiraceae bacterium]|nr:hypothetical protein [Lachnospiraceae bacterium]